MTEEQWFSEDIATFGDRLADARDAASLTQAGLAAKIGVKLVFPIFFFILPSQPKTSRYHFWLF